MRSSLCSLALLALGCAGAPASPAPPASSAPARFAPDAAPEALAPAVARADAAIRQVRERLQARLAAELARGGPAAAVEVCRRDAPAIAAEVAAEAGVAVGRTSPRLRNPANAPRPWAAPLVAEAEGKRAADVRPVALDLGDRVAILRPIPTAGACLACHGGPERIAPEVKAALSAAYPQDRATGFAEGELRGFFWAEAPR